MKINLEALLVMDAIDRKGSFASAAEEIHRVPSAITYTIQKLERDLDIKLFDRSGHRALLTEAGQKLLNDGRQILNAVGELEDSVKRVATGWEAELRIAVGDLVPMNAVLDLVGRFYTDTQGTQIRLQSEVFGGAWDALFSNRADLVLGTTGEAPLSEGYSTLQLGEVEFIFVAHPDHPIMAEKEPLSSDQIQQYRAIAAADSSRNLPPRTAGLLTGQEVLTVPDLLVKRETHLRGFGVGTMPLFMVREDIDAGRLKVLQVENALSKVPVYAAWRSSRMGKAMEWFLDRLKENGQLWQ